MRIINLVLTAIFGIYGYIAGIAILVLCVVLNKTVSGQSYMPSHTFCAATATLL